MQKAVLDPGARHLDPVGKDEGALEGAGGDAAMQEHPALDDILGLTAADDELAILDGDRKIRLAEARDGQRDAEAVFGGLFDVEGRIAVIAGLGSPLDQPFKLIEPQKEGMGGKGQFRHLGHVLGFKRQCVRPRFGDHGYDMVGRTPFGKGRTRRKAFRKSVKLLWSGTGQTTSRSAPMNAHLEMDSLEVLRVKLGVLRQEHRDLDEAVHAMETSGRSDQLSLRRLKKQKLMLKDQIARLEDILTPDIIA